MDEETKKMFDKLFEQIDTNKLLMIPWFEWVRRNMPFKLTEESTQNLMSDLIKVTIIQNGLIGSLTEIVGQGIIDNNERKKDIQHLLKLRETDTELTRMIFEYLDIKP